MSDEEVIRVWKDPEADRLGIESPLGELDLAEFTGGLKPTSGTGPTYCGSCAIASVGCC